MSPRLRPSAPAQERLPDTPEDSPQRRRGADTRALTQVLFGELKNLEPGSPEHGRVRAALIEANLPLVRYAAARFRSRNEPMEDVVQVGTIGLINAIDRFDPDRGVQFPTFAMPTVVGEIKRYFRDNVRTVHVPRRLHELWVQVNSATEDLTTAFGRTPTTGEIAERLRITEDEVLACIEAGRSYHATSLEAAQEGDGLPGLLDRLGYEDPALDGVEHRDLVRHLLVQLPEREQRILLLRYYSNLTQSQISAELGVSQMHVSRLLARSFATTAIRKQDRGVTRRSESTPRPFRDISASKNRQTPLFQGLFTPPVSTCHYSVLPTCDILPVTRLPQPHLRYSGGGCVPSTGASAATVRDPKGVACPQTRAARRCSRSRRANPRPTRFTVSLPMFRPSRPWKPRPFPRPRKPSTPAPCPAPCSCGSPHSTRTAPSVPTYGTRSSSSTSRWCVTRPRVSGRATSRWRTSSRSARSA